MNPELSLVSVEIMSDEIRKGSGCLLWSEDHNVLYCITAAHCIKELCGKKIQVKNKEYFFSDVSVVICIDDERIDVAVLKINDEQNMLDVPAILTYDCTDTQNDELWIIGFPKISKGEQIEVKCSYIQHDEDTLTITLNSLDPHLSERYEEVDGFSGCGCFIKSGSKYKYIGMENRALNTQVSYKNLYCVRFNLINEIIVSAGFPCLSPSTPEYITDGKLHFNLASEFLFNQFKNEWCETQIYSDISREINIYLNDDEERTALFIGGLSGSGKTRSVLNAVKDNKIFIYYSCFKDFCDDENQIMNYHEKFYIIVDEVSIDNHRTINSIIRGKEINFKIIAIGCTPSNPDYGYDNGNTIFLNKLTKEDTIAVIKANYDCFEESVYQAIYDLSSNDLRLALMIAKIYDKDRSIEIATIPAKQFKDDYGSAKQILSKMLELSIEEKPQNLDLERCFNHFSLFIDIGFKNQYECELKELSNYFKVNYSDYRRAIDYFEQIQLGIKKGDYFEASPRALAKYAFEQNAYSLVMHELDGFMSSITSETLRKRFIERAIECGIKEVAEDLSSWFLRNYSIHSLNDKVFSKRELMLLTEYFPETGLRIIKDYIVSSDSDLNRIGEISTYGIRRYIVWTCEHLACFKQYFNQCEEILFMLAQCETELYISNNSQGTWSGLFSILLSTTEVSYKKRYELLLKRALEAKVDYASLFEKTFEIVFLDGTSRIVPPPVIGNKITPARWKPQNNEELIDIKKYTLEMLLKNKNNFSSEIKSAICNALLKAFLDFSEYGLMNEYKRFTDEMIETQDQKNALMIVLEEYLNFQKKGEKKSDEEQKFIQKWSDELKQSDIDGKLHAFLTRDIWSYGYTDEDIEKRKQFASDLAREFVDDSDKVEKLCKIIKEEKYKEEPLFEFAEKLALIDSDYEFLSFIDNLTEISRNNPFSKGYYYGLFKNNDDQLPDNAIAVVEKIQKEEPDFTLWVSVSLDYNKDSFNRLIELIPKAKNFAPLLNLRSKMWIDILTSDEKGKIIEAILECDNANKYNIIFSIFFAWLQFEADTEESVLIDLFLEILKECIEAKTVLNYYLPESILVSLPTNYQKKGIEIFVPLFEFDNYFGKSNNAVIDYIKKIKNKTNESFIFKTLADRLLTAQRQVLTRAQTGIFDDYPLDIIKEWLEEDEVNRPVLMAYHLTMPNLDKPDFSELTHYILKKYEDNDKVYQKFWIGNTNLVTYIPQNIVDNKARWYELTEKYINSSDKRIKQWAEDKRKEIVNICDDYYRSEETFKRNS